MFIRKVGPEIFGIVNMELYFIHTSITMLCTNYLRNIAMKYESNMIRKRDQERNIFKLGWWSMILSILIAYFIYKQTININYDKYINESDIYRDCFIGCIIAGLIEMIAEPYILIATKRDWEKEKTIIESVKLFLRAIISFGFIVYYGNNFRNRDEYLKVFTFGQLCSSVIFVIIWILFMVYNVSKNNAKLGETGLYYYSDMLPSFGIINDEFLIRNIFTCFLQNCVHYILSEGEKIVMFYLNINDTILGTYALVSNLGSLVARFIFKPIEKMSRSEFSKFDMDNISKRDLYRNILQTSIKLVFIISFICVIYSPNYSYMVLNILYNLESNKWKDTNIHNVLSFYCIYLMVMSINGISEAFIQPHITNEFKSSIFYNIFLIFTTVLYWILIKILIDYNLGCYGIIIANIIAMISRIVYNYWCIYSWKINISIFIISVKMVILSLFLYIFTYIANDSFIMDYQYNICYGNKLICYSLHILCGIISVLITFIGIYTFEKPFYSNLKTLIL